MAKKQKYDFDLVIIGSGAAGGVAAHIAAAKNKKVALIEADTLGGECPNWGCVPSKALLNAAAIYDAAKHGEKFGLRSGMIGYNYPSIKAWKDLTVRRTGAAAGKSYYEAEGVTVLKGTAHFIGEREISLNRRHISAENFLISTGSSWAVPSIEGLEKVGYLTARDAMELTRPPKSLFVIGAGATGCEFAQLFSTFGSKIYLSDVSNRILVKEDEEISNLISRVFTNRRGMTILSSSKVLKVSKDSLMTRVTFERGGQTHSVKVDALLLTAGKTPNTDLGLENAGVKYNSKGIQVNEFLQTTAKHIYAAGDVIGGYMFTHVSTYEGHLAIHNLLARDRIAADYRAIPRVTFLTPELASVGLSEADCLRHDLKVKTAVAPLNIIARANTSDFSDGLVKVIADKNGLILGASIASPHAGEMIHELSLAIQYGLTTTEVASAIHAFPTWSEAVRVACAKIN